MAAESPTMLYYFSKVYQLPSRMEMLDCSQPVVPAEQKCCNNGDVHRYRVKKEESFHCYFLEIISLIFFPASVLAIWIDAAKVAPTITIATTSRLFILFLESASLPLLLLRRRFLVELR